MLLDDHTAPSVVDRLGISNVNLLYGWKQGAAGSQRPGGEFSGSSGRGTGGGTASR
jgi:transposase